MLLGILQDEMGSSMDLVWYRAPKFLIAGLAKDQTLLVHGKLEPSMHGRLRLVHPDFEIIENTTIPGCNGYCRFMSIRRACRFLDCAAGWRKH